MARVKNFRLQKVLEFKEHLEVMSTLELHKAQNKQKEAENTLKRLMASKHQLLQQADEQFNTKNKLDLTDLKMHLSYLGQLHESIDQQNKTIKNLTQVVEKKRQALKEAVKERKIIQSLKDQFTEQQKQEVKKIENERIDEIAIRKKSNSAETGA